MGLVRRASAALALLCAMALPASAATPLLQYLYSATSGTTIADTSTGTAASATVTAGASGAWTSAGTNKNGYNFASTATSTTASLSGTKVQTALSGSKTVTLELVIDSAQASNTYDSFLKLADGSDTGIFGVTINQGQGGLIFSAGEGNFPNDCLVKYAVPTSGIYVLTIVVDSSQATAANRVLVYVNGSAVTPSIIDQLGLNVALDTAVNWSTVVLTMGAATASPQGKNYYTTVYVAAVASGTVATNATALAANNDADPNGGAVATPDPFFLAWSPPPLITPGARRAPIEVIDAALPWQAIRGYWMASTPVPGGSSGAGGTGGKSTYEEYRRAHCRRFPDLCQ